MISTAIFFGAFISCALVIVLILKVRDHIRMRKANNVKLHRVTPIGETDHTPREDLEMNQAFKVHMAVNRHPELTPLNSVSKSDHYSMASLVARAREAPDSARSVQMSGRHSIDDSSPLKMNDFDRTSVCFFPSSQRYQAFESPETARIHNQSLETEQVEET
jgi:hypothetical protein